LDTIKGLQIQGATATGTAIDLCQSELVANTRPGIPNVILLITDGDPDEGPNAITEANKAKLNGTQLFVVGVNGDGGFNLTELEDLASFPLSYHLYNISDYGALLGIGDQLSEALCFTPGAAPIDLLPLFALLAVLPLGFFGFVIVRRRKKPKKVAPAPIVEEEAPPPPTTRAASPKPITDKPKDWSVPGTRYIGFGQANIKVKWGTEAPPSAPRGHDKYDRWSMMAHPDGMKPGSPTAASAMNTEGGMADGAAGGAAVGGAGAAGRVSCCARCCPCFFASSLTKTKQKLGKNPDEEDGNWQSNPASM